ncbi:MAG TPA: hypothetical protein VFW87_02850 [Pirellulales bacterium]|nr:hypothetical protein [Pirellulales bacterium]
MSRHLFLMVVSAVVTLFVPNAVRSSEAGAAAEHPRAAAATTPASGVIMIEEDIWMRLADEPADHLRKAQAAVKDGKRQEAAREVEKASAFVFAAAGHLGYRHKSALHDSAEELDRLANRLREDRLDSEESLTDAFGRAQFALAAYHLAQADRILKGHDAPSLAKAADQKDRDAKHCSTAGHCLQAAADYLEGSAKWRDEDDEAIDRNAGQMRKLAKLLIACDVSIADATDQIAELDEQIVALDRRREAPQAAAKPKRDPRQ